LKLHKEFQYIYNKGKAQHSYNVVLFFLPQQHIKRVGFTATKKVGNAVSRNRAKRRLRSLFVKYSNSLKDGTYIFVAKPSIVDSSFENLDRDFKKIVSRSKAFKKENQK